MPHHNRLIDFAVKSDARGDLVALQEGAPLPFAPARIFYIYNTRDQQPRGFHAHYRLQQFLVCLCGSCAVILDDGKSAVNYHLKLPTQGLYIAAMTWTEIRDISEDCLILVLADAPYDENDYIRNYEEFKRLAQKP